MGLTIETFYQELDQAGLTDVFFRDLLDATVPLIDADAELRFGRITPSNYEAAIQTILDFNENPVAELIDWELCDGGWDAYQDFHDYLVNKYDLGD